MGGIYLQLMKLRHFEVVDPFWIPFLTKWPKSVLLYTLLRTVHVFYKLNLNR